MKENKALNKAIEVQAHVAHLKQMCGEEDQELLVDMIEGETDVDGLVGKLIEMIQLDEADCDGLKTYQRKLADRKKRLEERATRLRTLLASVVTELPDRAYRHSLAHVRAFDVDPRIVVTDESTIPSIYWLPQDPKLNESAMRKHLLARQTLIDLLAECRTEDEKRTRRSVIEREYPAIAGVSLGNGEISVRIRGA
jgi:hypothetical protein